MNLWKPPIVCTTVFVICVLGLIRTQLYYGNIFRGWDPQFYHSVAHSLVFDQDVDITNNISETPFPDAFDQDGDGHWEYITRTASGRIPSKYPIGMSLIEAPLLAAGNLVAETSLLPDQSADRAPGYRRTELWSVALGLQLLFAVGLSVLFQLLRTEFGVTPALAGTLCCWLGTSLFFYSAVFPFWAHASSFVLLTFLMWITRPERLATRLNQCFAFAGLCLALLFLVRPQQVLIGVFLLPMAFASIRKQPTARWLPGVALGALCCVVAIAGQVLFNHSQTGVASISGYSAGGEAFSYLNPRLDIVLVSASRGAFVYSPILLLALIGFAFCRRQLPAYVWPYFWNAVAQVYLIAAWSSPEQGDSFGCRMICDNAAVVGFGLAALYSTASGRLRVTAGSLYVSAVAWTMFMLVNYITAMSYIAPAKPM